MNETSMLAFAWIAGGAIGALFFGGLWWTVRRCVSSEQPASWMFGSLLLRMGVTLTGFFFVSSGHWQRLVACLIGFVMARLVVTWLTRPKQTTAQIPVPVRRHGHAP